MGAVITYAETVRQIMDRVASHLKRIPKPGVETHLIADADQGIYLLQRVGWHEKKRVNNIVLFARIRDGKIWIEEDNTDLPLADELVRAGIPKEDIVLGFQPPERRHLTEFAVA
ncbi:MAG: XisI protein [Planctomycetia bacterium]|nr:XisI protein [Planctomycetia bacterium]